MNRLLVRLGAGAAALAGGFLGLNVWEVARDIRQQSMADEVRPADVIIVLGAAEYSGRPSPILEARLNHALFLYHQNVAPRILTTGGAGGDKTFTEAGVGRAYLTRRGIPEEAVIAETEGSSTVESTAAAAEIMRRMGLKSGVVVSDGYHIYRVKKMLESEGIHVYGSPRPTEPKDDWPQRWRYLRQAIAYDLWRMGIAV